MNPFEKASQAEAPPINIEGTLRNTDYLEADRTRKAKNKRLTLPIMTRLDDGNKKEQKTATRLSVAL
ncbi:hypothetical protein T01_14941 [Trichinella spiralis]|uniref:Uncharacterized protein n=1 Tax=Trichinella spiralis TaxID=6334 RepID=A0A0V1BTL4_TRISP|nr:hypothetical protein T01_14941 [Trichinella spiralis]